MMKFQRIFCAVTVAALLQIAPPSAFAQKIVAQVSLNLEKLPQEIKTKLTDFQEQITRYINDYEWTDNTNRYDLPLKLDIYFEQATPTDFEDRYDTRLVVSNQGDFQASDKYWRFPYRQGGQLLHTEQFHPLTSVIDLYVYELLGQEFDKSKRLGGEAFFQKAMQITQQSKFSEFYEYGWKERIIYLEKLTAPAITPYRELEYFFSQAQYRMRTDDRKTAGQWLQAILLKLEKLDIENPNTARFYELHHLNFARMLASLNFKTQLQRLAALDPSHVATYAEFLKQMGG